MATLTNTNQLFPGGRRHLTSTYYNLLAVTKNPTFTSSALEIIFANGEIEINNKSFNLNSSLNLNLLGSTLKTGKYIVGAVPAYLEPLDMNDAVAQKSNYYIYTDFRRQSFARPFIDPAITAEVNSYGGLNELSKKVYTGCSTVEETQVFNRYYVARQKMLDPRCSLKVLRPNGIKLVLIQIQDQDNYANCNVLDTLPECEFRLLEAQVPEFLSERKRLASADIDVNYLNKKYLLKRVFLYASANDADNNLNPVEVPYPFDLSSYDFVAYPEAVVYEYTYPSNIGIGQEGDRPKILRMLSFKDSELLGRINPIYLENLSPNASFGSGMANRLTHYGEPLGLVEIDVNIENSSITLVKEIYESYI